VSVIYHTDGAAMDAVEGLIDVGIDVLQALQFRWSKIAIRRSGRSLLVLVKGIGYNQLVPLVRISLGVFGALCVGEPSPVRTNVSEEDNPE
jgi:hypothetical protein